MNSTKKYYKRDEDWRGVIDEYFFTQNKKVKIDIFKNIVFIIISLIIISFFITYIFSINPAYIIIGLFGLISWVKVLNNLIKEYKILHNKYNCNENFKNRMTNETQEIPDSILVGQRIALEKFKSKMANFR